MKDRDRGREDTPPELANQQFFGYWETLPDSGMEALREFEEEFNNEISSEFPEGVTNFDLITPRGRELKEQHDAGMNRILFDPADRRLTSETHIRWALGLKNHLKTAKIPQTFSDLIFINLDALFLSGINKSKDPTQFTDTNGIYWVFDTEIPNSGGIFDPIRAETLSEQGYQQLQATHRFYTDLYQELRGPNFRQSITPKPPWTFSVDVIENKIFNWNDEHQSLFGGRRPKDLDVSVDFNTHPHFRVPHR